ncbi:hypothetical protein D3C84_991790 [compost metagenome]
MFLVSIPELFFCIGCFSYLCGENQFADANGLAEQDFPLSTKCELGVVKEESPGTGGPTSPILPYTLVFL